MKQIPCPTCKDVAVGAPSTEFPKGAPVLVGRFTSSGPMVVKCAKCKRAFKVDALAFNALPDLTQEQLKALGRVG